MLPASRKHEFYTIRSIIRHAAACAHGDYAAVTCLIEACYLAEESNLGEQYLLPGIVILKRAVREYGFGDDAVPSQFVPVVERSVDLGAERIAQLDLVGENLEQAVGCPTHEALLLGDAAILAVLYQDLGAFPSEYPRVALPSRVPLRGGRGESRASGFRDTATLYPEIAPGRPAATLAPTLEEALSSHSRRIDLGGHAWLAPRGQLLLALLAAHVGDPERHAAPPVWPHLALAAKRWGREISSSAVVETGRALGLEKEVKAGLVIAYRLFPELESWVSPGDLGLSALALRLAVPLAARRLVARSVP